MTALSFLALFSEDLCFGKGWWCQLIPWNGMLARSASLISHLWILIRATRKEVPPFSSSKERTQVTSFENSFISLSYTYIYIHTHLNTWSWQSDFISLGKKICSSIFSLLFWALYHFLLIPVLHLRLNFHFLADLLKSTIWSQVASIFLAQISFLVSWSSVLPPLSSKP